MGRKITILGMGMSSRERRWDIERYCEGTEIWGLNNGYETFRHLQGKWSRYFELHDWDYLREWTSEEIQYFRELNDLGCPIATTTPLPLIENQVKWDGLAYCKHFKTNYFLGSPSMMLMMALYEHDHGDTIDEIGSYGIDTTDESHRQQRTSWAWWLRPFHDRGIKFNGTATAFQAEKDNDGGLDGLANSIGHQMIEDKQYCQEHGIELKEEGTL